MWRFLLEGAELGAVLVGGTRGPHGWGEGAARLGTVVGTQAHLGRRHGHGRRHRDGFKVLIVGHAHRRGRLGTDVGVKVRFRDRGEIGWRGRGELRALQGAPLLRGVLSILGSRWVWLLETPCILILSSIHDPLTM